MQSSETRPGPLERLALFIQACNYGGDLGRMDVYEVRTVVTRAVGATVANGLPDEDRRLLKIAAATVAFYRELKRVSTEDVDLDFREEEILRAVQEKLAEEAN